MTTEDDFQAALDANPADWQTRLVFADWLQDRSDPRAEGYRVLGATHFVPLRVEDTASQHFAWTAGADDNIGHRNHAVHGLAMVTRDWYRQVKPPVSLVHIWSMGEWWAYFYTRRECEDALALAFTRLPQERRLELLGSAPIVPGARPPHVKKQRSRKKPATKEKQAKKKPSRKPPK